MQEKPPRRHKNKGKPEENGKKTKRKALGRGEPRFGARGKPGNKKDKEYAREGLRKGPPARAPRMPENKKRKTENKEKKKPRILDPWAWGGPGPRVQDPWFFVSFVF